MNNIEIIEAIIVITIVIVQFRIFISTYGKIRIFKSIIPDLYDVKIIKLNIPNEDISTNTPHEILSQKESYYEIKSNNNVGVDILFDERTKGNSVFHNILTSINTYLIRNKGAIADFNIVKDITERNIGTIEEEINLTITIPLYLGLMGTMLGIVIGLFYMSDISGTLVNGAADQKLGSGINILLGGVKIAMIASFMGLLLTIINSGYNYKGSKSIVETKKNNFYSYVQTELVSCLNQNLSSTFDILQRNLYSFNKQFTDNINNFSSVFDINYKTLQTQKEIISRLEKIDFSRIANVNMKMLNELTISSEKLETFNLYLNQVNSFVEKSNNLTGKLNDLLDRTENFKTVAEAIELRMNESQALLGFLSTHFKELEERKSIIRNTVITVDYAITDAIGELKSHTQKSIENVKEFTINEVDSLKSALSESKTNLSNLEYLGELNKEVGQIKNSLINQNGNIIDALNKINENLITTMEVLQKAKRDNYPGIFVRIKNWLIQKV